MEKESPPQHMMLSLIPRSSFNAAEKITRPLEGPGMTLVYALLVHLRRQINSLYLVAQGLVQAHLQTAVKTENIDSADQGEVAATPQLGY